jgi:hypothetical protein
MAWQTGSPQAGAAEAPLAAIGEWKPATLPPGVAPGTPAYNNYMKGVRSFIDSGSRRLYTYYPGWLAAFDLDTLAPRGAGRTFTGVANMAYPDPQSGTFFVAIGQTGVGGTLRLDQFVSAPTGLELVSSIDLTAQLPEKQIVGISRLASSGRMWLVSERVGRTTGYQLGGGVTITELNINPLGQAPTHVWSTELPDCFSPMRTTEHVNAGLGFVSSRNALYFGCGNGKAPLDDLSPRVRRGVARLSLHGDPRNGPTTPPTTADFAIFARDGDYSDADSFFDPGSDRMLFTALGGGGSVALVFDARTELYVGGIATGGNKVKQPGFDPTIGRFYAGGLNIGILVTDVASRPLSQGLSFPEFQGDSSNPIGASPMAVDTMTRRLFVKYDGAEVYRIVKDNLPPYIPPPDLDVDANTTDVEEEEGKTRSTFSSSAQGFGSRVRQVGGVASLAINYGGRDTRQYGVEGGTREYRAAYLDSLALANSEASAAAISFDRDAQNTQGDLEKTKPNNESPPAVDWPYKGASCFDFGSQPKDSVTVDDSVVSCDADGHRVDASSTSRPMSSALFTVDSGALTSGSRLDATKGVVATANSNARGISFLNGVLRIGNVESAAQAWAKGRPGTAGSDYTRVVRDVRLNDQPLCAQQCDTNALAAQINSALAGRVHVSFPTPDPTVRGSKGGYQAVVRRSPDEQVQEIVLNEQPADRIEVPGMVVTIFEDAQRPSRTVIELAAVEVEARYGISVAGGDGGFDDGGDGTAGPLFGLGPLEDPYLGGPAGTPLNSPGLTSNSPRGRAGGGNGVLTDTGKLIWNGLKGSLKMIPIWAVLLAPIYLSARRWLLLQRASLISGGPR